MAENKNDVEIAGSSPSTSPEPEDGEPVVLSNGVVMTEEFLTRVRELTEEKWNEYKRELAEGRRRVARVNPEDRANIEHIILEENQGIFNVSSSDWIPYAPVLDRLGFINSQHTYYVVTSCEEVRLGRR